MKKLLFYLTLLSLCGCQTISSRGSQSRSSSGECPETPEIALNPKYVQEIELSNQMIIVSGIAKKTKFVGFTFEANQGQKFDYNTDDDICVWIYTPDNEIINSKKLPKTGKYTIQVLAPQGSQTFDIEMSLDTNESSRNPSTTASERPSPEQFVSNHYSKLNQRDYENTWQLLSPKFQNIAGNYFEYTRWWYSVQEIKISQVRLIEKNDGRAIVYADLQYIMKNDGRIVQDTKPHIHLIWDETSNSWLFDKKT